MSAFRKTVLGNPRNYCCLNASVIAMMHALALLVGAPPGRAVGGLIALCQGAVRAVLSSQLIVRSLPWTFD